MNATSNRTDRVRSPVPTSHDVAQRAGVSQSAVSRCFRKGSSISAKTRARVMAAVEELGYHSNALASGLITRRSNLVAVIISNLTNLYYPEVLAELTRRLSERGVRVLLFTLQAESDVDEMLDQVWRYRVEGAISQPGSHPNNFVSLLAGGSRWYATIVSGKAKPSRAFAAARLEGTASLSNG